MMRHDLWTAGTLALLATAAAGPASAQGVEGQVGRFYDDSGWDVYRLGVSRPLTGPLGLGLQGNYLRRADGADGSFAGVSVDLTGFKGGVAGPYLVAGVGAGMGSPQSSELSEVWSSWSVGAGYQLFPVSFLAFGAEARWRELSLDRRDGLEMTAGLSIRFGGSGRSRSAPSTADPVRAAGAVPPAEIPISAPPASVPAEPLPADTPVREPVRLRQAIIATAKDAMGRPYSWGGTGENGSGFDCSGLIQHAYGEHGIPLPRTSADQAREGKKLAKKVGSLAPGDLLTFSNRGGAVTHVGLYLGDGRFIHSASRGVQISVLSGEDPYGRWWYKRWVGARRIVDE